MSETADQSTAAQPATTVESNGKDLNTLFEKGDENVGSISALKTDLKSLSGSVFGMNEVKMNKFIDTQVWESRLRTYSMYIRFGKYIVIMVVVGYILFWYFYKYRQRWSSGFSRLIKLEPYNQSFCAACADALFVIQRNKMVPGTYLPQYDSRILQNLRVYETILMSDFTKVWDIVRTTEGFPATFEHETEGGKRTAYLGSIAAVVNTYFSWSGSPKLGDRENADKLIAALKEMAAKREDLEDAVSQGSLLSYYDRENAMDAEMNMTLLTYGRFANPPLAERATAVLAKYTKKDAEGEASLKRLLESNPAYAETEPLDARVEIDAMFERMRLAIFTRWEEGNEESFQTYTRMLDAVAESKTNTLGQCGRSLQESGMIGSYVDSLPEDLRASYDSLLELNVIYSYLNASDPSPLFYEVYHKVETMLRTPTDPVVYKQEDIDICMGCYQRALDMVYMRKNRAVVELAIDTTLHVLVDPSKDKLERLDSAGSTYVTIQNALMMIDTEIDRLKKYNTSRNPNIKELIKLYKRKIRNSKRYFIDDMIVKPWKEYFSAVRPHILRPYMDWLRDIFGFQELMKMLFNDDELKKMEDDENAEIAGYEAFRSDSSLKKADVVETFVWGEITSALSSAGGEVTDFFKGLDPVEKIAEILRDWGSFFDNIGKNIMEIPNKITDLGRKIFEFGKKVGDFLKNVGRIFKKIAQLIANPVKFLEFIVRVLIFIAFLPVSILYSIPIPPSMRMAEFVTYLPPLLFITVLFSVVFVIVWLWIMFYGMLIDVQLFRGKLYVWWYRMFLATENAPNAWYTVGNYHNNNKADRMILSWKPCPDSYVPDKATAKTRCKRTNISEPNFCPQANIFRSHKELSRQMPTEPLTFVPDAKFVDASPESRRRQLQDHHMMKLEFHKRCDAVMGAYDATSKTICRNAGHLPLNESNYKTLEGMCYEAYCHHGKREAFCARTSKPKELDRGGITPAETVTDRSLVLINGTLFIGVVTLILCHKLVATNTSS